MMNPASFPGRILQQAQEPAPEPQLISVEAIVIVGVAALLVLALALVLKGRVSAKGKFGDMFEGELSAEEKTRPGAPVSAPTAPTMPTDGAHFDAGSVKNSKVFTADQTPGAGSATTNVRGAVEGSTVVTVSGPVDLGSVVGGAAAGAPRAESVSDSVRSRVVNVLETRFSVSDMEGLCFEMGIDDEEVPGDVKSKKARELVVYCERRQRVPELIALIKKKRNNTGL